MYYTYLLGWKKENKFYYGVRYSKKSKIEDVGVTYFSSSKYVKLFIEKHGLPDIIEIRKIFNNKEDAIQWESRVLKRLKIPNNDNYLNRWDNSIVPINVEGPYPFEYNKIQIKVDATLRKKYNGRGAGSEIIKEKMFQTNNRKYGSHHTLNLNHVSESRKKANIEKYGVDNPFKSKEFQQSLINPMNRPEIREKHKKIMEEKDWSERNTKSKNTNIKKYGMSNPMNRPEIREKNKQACPYCLKTFNAGGFTIHMDKIHSWSKEEIKEYKDENKKNSN